MIPHDTDSIFTHFTTTCRFYIFIFFLLFFPCCNQIRNEFSFDFLSNIVTVCALHSFYRIDSLYSNPAHYPKKYQPFNHS
ncbi:hypothetical protein BCR42DRAFT_412486 [Absidia repens]|uniref:Uncharacterized protein n=1 Tax=Absidia repens TaxID=90262 RepID=A0A1X2IL97_9FUNG|nr:hypothetical protein BCR42DRAFT_412486 [Absidia repens]